MRNDELDKPTLIKTTGKIKIYFVPLIEYMSVYDQFEPEDAEEIARKIDRYDLVYFVAKVYAEFNGLEIGTDYLEGCIYESYEDFYNGKYILDMIKTVESEAKDYLIDLKKELEEIEF